MARVLFGLFLVAHGLVHTGFVTRAPAPTPGAPEWPFAMSRSWLITGVGLDEGAVRWIGAALVVITVVAFVASGFAWFGFVLPEAWWTALVVVGSAASIALLAGFFHPWLVVGFAIDLVLIYLATGAGWSAQPSLAP